MDASTGTTAPTDGRVQPAQPAGDGQAVGDGQAAGDGQPPRGPGTGWSAPVGVTTGRRVHYELIGCALHGHAVPRYPGRARRPEDPALAREMAGLVWHRCLRCDAWLPAEAAPDPGAVQAGAVQAGGAQAGTGDGGVGSADPAARDGVTPPLRGRLLRDRYVLRLIAVDRAVHVVVLAALAALVLLFARHRDQLQGRFARVVADLQGSVGGPVHAGGHGVAHDLTLLFSLGTGSLYAAGGVLAAYAVLEAVEMVGLWRARRWAEYLTFVATVALLPLEVYELTRTVSAAKVLTLLVNLAIAAYLLSAKRLFGVRGGGRREAEERAQDSGWLPIDRATPPTGTAATT